MTARPLEIGRMSFLVVDLNRLTLQIERNKPSVVSNAIGSFNVQYYASMPNKAALAFSEIGGLFGYHKRSLQEHDGDQTYGLLGRYLSVSLSSFDGEIFMDKPFSRSSYREQDNDYYTYHFSDLDSLFIAVGVVFRERLSERIAHRPDEVEDFRQFVSSLGLNFELPTLSTTEKIHYGEFDFEPYMTTQNNRGNER